MNTLKAQMTTLQGSQAIMSACTAHPLAIEAVLEHASMNNVPALIEATANQVNQYGGYTGMLPTDFVEYIRKLTAGKECKVILGGDHLGPLVWRGLPALEAMKKSETLIEQYVKAGFTKIHIDTSMRLKDDPEILTNEVIAARAAQLCKIAETAAIHDNQPVYVIGSEVPIPGGAEHAEEGVVATDPEDFLSTISAFREAFDSAGLSDAWERVIAVVVQPGVEFGDDQIFEYDREKAKKLTAALKPLSPLVFEGHSTDYQTPDKLRQMAEDGIKIQKVGPALTFAVREALFALAEMEKWLVSEADRSHFIDILDEVMQNEPSNWKSHYHGTPKQKAFKRRFSLSDRARYYMTNQKVEKAADKLINNINRNKPPISLLSQYMPIQYNYLRDGKIELTAEALIKSRVTDCIETYPIR